MTKLALTKTDVIFNYHALVTQFLLTLMVQNLYNDLFNVFIPIY